MAGFTRSDGIMKQVAFYQLTPSETEEHFLNIVFRFQVAKSGTIRLQLPIWRPGRYQAQHFSKNIPQVRAFDTTGFEIKLEKKGTSSWEFQGIKNQHVEVRYAYFAQQADAGGSVSNHEILYVNFITCLMFVQGQEEIPCEVKVDIPKAWKVSTTLKESKKGLWLAPSYRELVDSTFMASEEIIQHHWQEGDVHFWAEGIGPTSMFQGKLLEAYRQIAAYQLHWMGHFPVKEYRFLHWIKGEAFYHGVEHRSSTMMVLGPPDRDLYDDLIGLASHELFHVWNIATIRPMELWPYNYAEEVYFPTAWFVEGVTTYLGDWFLVASGVYRSDEYLASLLGNLKLHFERDGASKQSLIESSIDLWLDGYGKAIPGKRVSIYYKGAIVALALDLMIRKKFAHRKSIRDVMVLMNDRFGIKQQGYALADVYQMVEEVYEASLTNFWRIWVEGNDPLEGPLNELMSFVGLKLELSDRGLLLNQLDEDLNLDCQKWLQGIIK
ncbi:M61 family metallopeptidase [Aquirufa nivalisilvae]|uniref:M61 family metallopeptidase n=1 Tax=Aquirufa nivalisilvae TaxID=2516557 RepID=UPI0022A99C7F|nr:M61 family peptidase [Aquirufa nivalisilvae]MCZ2479532.1 M61 family metallopeptidase [Aquirufa nivalisilvae]MCZ2481522.1 M61 family metallopeptidase [Aquirufa nivalisilvae]